MTHPRDLICKSGAGLRLEFSPLEDNVLSPILCRFSKYCALVFLYPLAPPQGTLKARVVCCHCSNVLRPPVMGWDLLYVNCIMQTDAWKIVSQPH